MKQILRALSAALLVVWGNWGVCAAVGHPTFLSPQVSPIALAGGFVFVANTPADTVDVIDARTRTLVIRIHVGIEPVSLAARPDGKEVWVANHVSDSVSVIDTDSSSPTYLQVIATVQDLDPATKATRFDEPVASPSPTATRRMSRCPPRTKSRSFGPWSLFKSRRCR